MTIAYVIISLLLALMLHEFSHALVMVRYGIKIKSLGIGLPWPKRVAVTIPLGKRMPVLKLHPLLLGAYVEAENEEDVTSLPIQKQNHISGAGVLVNLLTGSVIFLMLGGVHIMGIGFTTWVLVAITASILLLSKFISNYIVPLMGIGYLWLLVGTVVASGTEAVGGPATMTSQLSSSGFGFMAILAIVSILLGLANMLPIYPIDGGRIFVATLERLHAPKFAITIAKGAGVTMFVGLMVFVIYADVNKFI